MSAQHVRHSRYARARLKGCHETTSTTLGPCRGSVQHRAQRLSNISLLLGIPAAFVLYRLSSAVGARCARPTVPFVLPTVVVGVAFAAPVSAAPTGL